MTESIVVASFNVESEAFQALSEIKNAPKAEGLYKAIQGVVVKKEDGQIVQKDDFDTGAETSNDLLKGGAIGALIGLLGGPVGVLVGGGIGLFIGSGADTHDAKENASMIQRVSETINDGSICLIVLVKEKETGSFDHAFSKYAVSISRFSVEELLEEVKKAEKAERKQEEEIELP